MTDRRKSVQQWIQQWDLYANPVTLTYNQKKKFSTVSGAMCTCCSVILLMYLCSVAIISNLVHPSYSLTRVMEDIDVQNPVVFEIDRS